MDDHSSPQHLVRNIFSFMASFFFVGFVPLSICLNLSSRLLEVKSMWEEEEEAGTKSGNIKAQVA